MAYRKTVITSLLSHWGYCILALSHRNCCIYGLFVISINTIQGVHIELHFSLIQHNAIMSLDLDVSFRETIVSSRSRLTVASKKLKKSWKDHHSITALLCTKSQNDSPSTAKAVRIKNLLSLSSMAHVLLATRRLSLCEYLSSPVIVLLLSLCFMLFRVDRYLPGVQHLSAETCTNILLIDLPVSRHMTLKLNDWYLVQSFHPPPPTPTPTSHPPTATESYSSTKHNILYKMLLPRNDFRMLYS